MPTNWASLVIVVSCYCCIALQLAFTLAFLSSVRVIVMDTESRKIPKNVICSAGVTDDFCTLITNLKLKNNVCV